MTHRFDHEELQRKVNELLKFAQPATPTPQVVINVKGNANIVSGKSVRLSRDESPRGVKRSAKV